MWVLFGVRNHVLCYNYEPLKCSGFYGVMEHKISKGAKLVVFEKFLTIIVLRIVDDICIVEEVTVPGFVSTKLLLQILWLTNINHCYK